MKLLLFTKKTIEKIIRNQKLGVFDFFTSSDLGRSETRAIIKQGILSIDNQNVDLSSIKRLKEDTIYFIQDKKFKPLILFSEKTNKVYKLIPTRDYPSFTIAGSPMHQITFSTPKKDTESKVKLFGRIDKNSIALDTCFGLGYSAIELSKRCKEVYSFEKDEIVLKIAKINPYSSEAFKSDKIKLKQEDVFSGIKNFPENYFDIILHDPPTFTISPELYSREFYSELHRVLKNKGLLYHYTPRPGNKKLKRDFPNEVKKRLADSGFIILKYSDIAQGFICRKNDFYIENKNKRFLTSKFL